MQLRVLVTILLVLAAGSRGVRGQDSREAVAGSSATAVHKLVDMYYPDPVLGAMIDIVFDELQFSFPTMGQEEFQRIRDKFDVGAFREQLYARYDSSFTPEELANLLDFYMSPLGEKVRSVESTVWLQSWKDGQAIGRKMIERAVAGKSRPEIQWISFVPTDSSFTVLLPGEPSETVIPTRIPSGVVDAYQFMTTSSYCAYMVSYADSVSSGEGAEADAVLESVANTVFDRVGGELVSEMPLKYDVGPGRELTLMLADGDGVYRVRLFVSGGRLYQLTAVTPISEYYTSQVVHFFDSFELKSR